MTGVNGQYALKKFALLLNEYACMILMLILNALCYWNKYVAFHKQRDPGFDNFPEVVNDLEFGLDGHRLVGEITSQTDERDIAKKLLQLEKDCAYYVLKDLIFDNSVQVIAGQPLVLKEGGCPQLVLICLGNNNSTEGFIRSVLQRNQQHLPFVNAAASAGRLYLMFQEDVADILTRLDSKIALLQDNVNYLVQRVFREDRSWHVKVRAFPSFVLAGTFGYNQIADLEWIL
ncbi:hypothetical protein MIR68_009916 [Amoeboaphelidium protococcarum]|nr:hypothetical protein MIR68_009916 [Amoeboaphelidium protococcarum]